MKKFRLFPIILIICLLLSVSAPAAYALDQPELAANAAVLADMKTGRIIYSKNMSDRVAPASLTKIMTVLLAVEMVESGAHDLQEEVTAQVNCREGMDDSSSTAWIMDGETMTLESLIYCAMLASANEACNIIGYHLSGSVAAFVELMNQRASELGMTGTHFSNPNGLTAEDHYTTAYDFFLLANEAMKHPLFATVCNMKSYQVPATNVSEVRELKNSNALICSESMYGSTYLYEGASGIKTGFTQAAGYCLISTAERGGVSLLAVVMGCNGPLNSDQEECGHFTQSAKLYNWGFDNFAYKTVIEATEPLGKATVAQGEGDGTVILRPVSDVTVLVPKDTDLQSVETRVTTYDDKLVAPIAAGTVLGQAEIIVGGESCGTIDLVTNLDIGLAKNLQMAEHLNMVTGNFWFKLLIVLVVIFLGGYIALVVRYRRLRKKHLEEKRRAEMRRRMEYEKRYQREIQEAAADTTQRYSARSAIDPANDIVDQELRRR